MPMHSRTLRFPESLWRLIQNEAQFEGVSVSEFIRASVLASILIRRASADPEIGMNWRRARRECEELLRALREE